MRKRIDVEDVQQNSEERIAFDRPDLDEIDFYYDGKMVDIPQKEIEEFVFSGLMNTDFVTMRDWDEDNVVSIAAGVPVDADEHILDLEFSGQLHEDFGDPESLMNSRDWLREALEAKGAKVHGAGVGMGKADLEVELEGHEYIVSITPRLKGKKK